MEHREGAPVVTAVRAVLDPDATAGDADHRLGLRFFETHPDFFEATRRDGLVWAWPRVQAFTCSANKHGPKHTDGDGDSEDVGERGDGDAESRGQGGDIPKQNARAALNRRRMVESDQARGYLLGALATYRETTEDRYDRLHRVRGTGPEHLLVPYRTRFNAPDRVADARERLLGALDRAADQYNRAVMATLTTDPERFDSIQGATETLTPMSEVSSRSRH